MSGARLARIDLALVEGLTVIEVAAGIAPSVSMDEVATAIFAP